LSPFNYFLETLNIYLLISKYECSAPLEAMLDLGQADKLTKKKKSCDQHTQDRPGCHKW